MTSKLYRFAAFFSPIGIILLLSLPSIWPLFQPGFFNIHDFQHVARIFELDKSLLAGQFPVRWVSGLGFGFGYNLFNFYPPFVYYLGEIIHFAFRTGFLDSIKIIWAVALLGSACSMYFLCKELFGKIAGVVAAIFYLYAPYHALDAYVRGALAELFSFVWLPLILLFGYKAIQTGKMSNHIWAAIFIALLMLTHPLVFLPFFGLYSLWHFALLFLNRKASFIRNLFGFLLHSSLGFALSAFFWLPSIAEKHLTLTDQFLTKGLASYKIHFVCVSQLWNSPWGFGGSTPGCFDGISFMLGKIYIFTILAALFLITVIIVQKKGVQKIYPVIISMLLLLISLFMTTSYSKFLWDLIPQLWYLQFPWRFFEFTTLFSAILAGFLIFKIRNIKFKISLATILILTILTFQSKYFVPQSYDRSATDKSLTTEQQIKWVVSSTSFEYMPKGMPTRISENGGNMLDITIDQVGKTGYEIKSGTIKNLTEKYYPHKVSLSAESPGGAVLQFPITNFPGWTASLDQKNISIDDNNRLKLITVNFPKGKHLLELNFTNTPVRNIGNMISLVAVLLLPGFFYGARRNKK